jgi:serine/threonine protein kinase
MNPGQANQRLRPFKPQRFGRYTLLMPLSTGGMGEVFLARLEGSHGFDKPCVIKKILPHLAKEPGFVSRFVDEGHILVKLSHGNIAQVLDMGVQDEAPYIALEFIDGKDLRRVLARTRERTLPLPLSFVLSVMSRVLDALAYAHRKRSEDDRELNLVHRDISPQNILISYEGEVKIIDFGLAKSAMSVSNTNPSILLGKFMYMSPEQARHKAVDRRADLYSVALCIWELVAGKNPFEDVPSGEMIERVGNPTIPALNSIDPLCPRALSEAVNKALQVDPAQRFQSAEEFRTALQSILVAIDPSAGAESTSRFMRDAFASEYQQERRMLASLKEQARALETPERGPQEETIQPNTKSPFASKPMFLRGDEPTPIAAKALELHPTALSFAPTPKTVQLSGTPSKRDDVHEKETLPAIQLKVDMSKTPGPMSALPPMNFGPPDEPELDATLDEEQPEPFAPVPKVVTPPPTAGAGPIRARILSKSFDNDPTEAAAPAIPSIHTSQTVRALEPLPSIVLDGVESTSMPAPAPTPAKKKAPIKPRRTNSKTLKQAPPPPSPPRMPSGPLRTDTMVIRNPLLDPPPRAAAAAAPVKKGNTWLWFVVPLLALAAVGAFIAWDVHLEQQRKQADEAGQEAPAPEETK